MPGVRDSGSLETEITLNCPLRAQSRGLQRAGNCALALLLLLAAALPLAGREKDKLPYGEGLIVNIPVPVSEVEQVVEEIAQNGVIRGTKEYNKDEFISGAKAASSSRVFPPRNEGGKIFYKVREQAIDPRNFKDASDVGTLAVRYVVLAQGDKNTVLRIDALFKEDFRHIVHQSDGSVENAEYKDIQEHVEAIEVMKKQDVEAQTERQEQLAKKQHSPVQTYAPSDAVPQTVPQATQGQPEPDPQAGATPLRQEVVSEKAPIQTVPAQTLEEHVKDLRKQVERLVKAPGAPLKSAPFHTASTLQSLPTGTEILILISTPYWYGVETHEGQHGWILRDQLEQP
jgi:polyhydroxyalkanoate synthesis regulator phasin